MRANLLSLLIGVTLSCYSFAGNAFMPKQIVVFGDSYSDNGNTYRNSGNTYPGEAYDKGRFTNGPTWSEYLSSNMRIDPNNSAQFRNYAYGQAQAIDPVRLETHSNKAPKAAWQFSIPDLSGEVSDYLSQGDVDPSETLYFIFIGTNDFLNYTPGTLEDNQAFVKKIAHALEKQITRIEMLGATHVVVFNMRDLQLSPLAKQLAAKYSDNYIEKLNTMIKGYNQLLRNKYKNSETTVIYNVNSFDAKVFNEKSSKPCYVNQGNYIDQVGRGCDDSSAHYFYDRIHPTTEVNKLLSNQLTAFLQKRGW